MSTLTIAEAQDIAARVTERRVRWPNEDTTTSLLVVLLNYGDHLTGVTCVGTEHWTGIKADVAPRDGVPLCPNGHPLMEHRAPRARLGLIMEDAS